MRKYMSLKILEDTTEKFSERSTVGKEKPKNGSRQEETGRDVVVTLDNTCTPDTPRTGVTYPGVPLGTLWDVSKPLPVLLNLSFIN